MSFENISIPNNLNIDIVKVELMKIIDTIKENIFMDKNILKSIISNKNFIASDLDVFFSYLDINSSLVKELINVKFCLI